ncbi:DUF1624 domain-containing protein [Marinomonas piezotolerans]|uniref:DUF1624 domain-containing protein n=2 Tax=Marinomonas piezotolerans TaxID=2213058 RepID=A0A370U8D2_9GAMM|nr:DUF1624 domain-containing protein [Marinomonas piezotolerans]
MILFHFCWDLKTFGFMEYSLKDPFWVSFRYIILTLFLSAVGWSSYIATASKQPFNRFIFNQSKIGLAALLISMGSYLAMPNQWIFFGILHFIFLSSLITKPLSAYPIVSCSIGTFIVFATYALPIETDAFRHWLSAELGAPKHTLDYISPLPWIGVVLIGPILGYLKLEQKELPMWMSVKPITFIGRYALPVYLIHQLVLYPLVASIDYLVH